MSKCSVCICCEAATYEDCPLCEGLRYFINYEKLPKDLPCYMLDFYEESPLDPSFFEMSEVEKRAHLDNEIDDYFEDSTTSTSYLSISSDTSSIYGEL